MNKNDKKKFINGIQKIANKHAKINKCIQEGKPIPKNLSKNFITFPLTDNPYEDL